MVYACLWQIYIHRYTHTRTQIYVDVIYIYMYGVCKFINQQTQLGIMGIILQAVQKSSQPSGGLCWSIAWTCLVGPLGRLLGPSAYHLAPWRLDQR